MSAFETASSAISAINSLPPAIAADRLHIEVLGNSSQESAQEISGQDVMHGLTQQPKTLPPKYFYDDRGSQLFEQICELPEYYLTRTETTILQNCAAAIATITGECELVELGSGSSTKTRLLLDAYQALAYPLHYIPIDISAGILKESTHQLLIEYPNLKIHGLVGTYEQALQHLATPHLPKRLLFFLGSSLGNLSPAECDQFFHQIRSALQPGEYFLLGVDLHKSTDLLEAAYNDRQGVTAEFNLNMLRHLNQRFQGNFDLTQFEHWSFYNESLHQIEMHLRSLRSQTVELTALNFNVSLASGETIRTEISRKFDLTETQQQLQEIGLNPLQVWTDQHTWFGLLLCQVSDRDG
ncbi:L-histidine N(alpha)-methyltransferase [Pantanalinema sp. GBBB05]|uniref:L-histidine N(alpha)-methyltransferase n=1 Tax=Pantanalinema sp. GBBB05 TaxID=2604139 RepID=UPI001D35958C|nr:L-histidine N(alpha)-methyltransferase [Pantanalinema sp. GBBB05]